MTHGACELLLIWHISKDGALSGILALVTFHLLHSAQLIMSTVAAYKFDSVTDNVSATFLHIIVLTIKCKMSIECAASNFKSMEKWSRKIFAHSREARQ